MTPHRARQQQEKKVFERMVVLPETEYKRIKSGMHVDMTLEPSKAKPEEEEAIAIATNQPTMDNIVETAKMREEIPPTPAPSLALQNPHQSSSINQAAGREETRLESLLIRSLPQGVGKRAIAIIDGLNSLYPTGWLNPETLELLENDGASVQQLLNYVARDQPLMGQRTAHPRGLDSFVSMLHRAVNEGHLALKKLGKHVRGRVVTSRDPLIGPELAVQDEVEDEQVGAGSFLKSKYLMW